MLLEVENLEVSFDTPDGVVQAVRGVSFAVDAGKTFAIVGESGSGKSVTAQTILGLTDRARIRGHAVFDGRDLLTTSERELRTLRGAQIAMVFQNPHSSLHPQMRVGAQIAEVIRIHTLATRADVNAKAVALLNRVGIRDAERRADDYPHEFSGGMLQRAMIAMAIALSPKLLIADEPTTALDVTVQAQIIALLRELQRETGMALVLITHDLGVVAEIADDVMVMYAGRALECASRRALFYETHHPYTRGLMASLPRADRTAARLTPIRGQPPNLIVPPPGCPFHPRCDSAQARCHDEQPLVTIGNDSAHRSACWLPTGPR
ncbi:MAG TPA: ABC transporter ATP-binding protein [Gemmatimonadaceae bacterium]|nr:ABC transporter ATP-binding protein [Gemmatimonadaceae bacterium]